MARLRAKCKFRRARAVAAVIAGPAAILLLSAPALADPPARLQYDTAPPPPLPGREIPPGQQTGTEGGDESPAGVALDSLDETSVLLVLGAVLAITALVIVAARRRRLLGATVGAAAGALVLSILLLVALPGGAETSPPLPRGFWGVVLQSTPPQRQFDLMREGGVESIRIGISWEAVEKRPFVYDWAPIDQQFRRAARSGIEVLPSVLGTPKYLSPDSRDLPVRTGAERAAWVGFLRVLVSRYGPHGAFWAAHGSQSPQPLHYLPVRYWQIWNEPNFFYFAKPRSPALYGELLKVAHVAITSVDRQAKIVLGGLFARPKQGPPQALSANRFLDRLYRVPGVKSSFDAVALHPYAANAADVFPDVATLRAVMARHGDAETPLWITEIGWGSGRGTAFEKGAAGQGQQLRQAFDLLVENQQAWRIGRLYWFSWADAAGACNFCDSSGLVTTAGEQKPAWRDYRAFALGDR